MTFLIPLLIFLILFSGLFSATETALFSLSPMKRRALGASGGSGKLVFKLLERPRDLLVTILILNIFLNLLVQNVVSNIFGSYSSWALTVGVPLALTVIFGEVIPKSLALANNEKLSRWMARPLYIIQKGLYPLRIFLTQVTGWIAHIAFFFLKKEKEISVEELQFALDESKQSSMIAEEEAKLIAGYLDLSRTAVKEVMRPKDEVIYYLWGAPLEKLLSFFVDEECSRILVCEEDVDHVVGVISAREFFLHKEEILEAQDLNKFLTKPIFVPESTNAHALLHKMYEKQESLAIVVDEWGALEGIVTLEDLIENVVGEIADKRDATPPFSPAGPEAYIAKGKTEIAELEDLLGVPFTSENNMVTISGWLIEQMGDIPKVGERFISKEGILFQVLGADQKKIERLYIRKLPKKKGGA